MVASTVPSAPIRRTAAGVPGCHRRCRDTGSCDNGVRPTSFYGTYIVIVRLRGASTLHSTPGLHVVPVTGLP